MSWRPGSNTFSIYRQLDFSSLGLHTWKEYSIKIETQQIIPASVLEAQEAAGTSADRGILASDLNSDGSLRELLYVDGGVSTTGTAGHLRMQGNLVFRHAVEKLAKTAHHALDKAGLAPEVTGIPTADYPTPAARPLNSRLDCGRIARDFGIARPDWRAGLTRVLSELETRR